MPKRSTHTFESEKDGVKEEQLGLQYCTCCGESVLILGPGIKLVDLPRRRVRTHANTSARARPQPTHMYTRPSHQPRPCTTLAAQTDGAIVLERDSTTFRLKTQPKGSVVIRRRGGYERQWRMGCWKCGVLVAYRAVESEDPPLTYLLNDATCDQADLYLARFKVPQCIQPTGERSVRVAMDIVTSQPKRAVLHVQDSDVGVSVVAPSKEGLANAEVLDFMSKVLGVTRGKLSLARGWSHASKFLLVSGLEPEAIFKRLKGAIESGDALGPLAMADGAEAGASGFIQVPGDESRTQGHAVSVARRNWEEAEEYDDLAAPPSKKQQTFIK